MRELLHGWVGKVSGMKGAPGKEKQVKTVGLPQSGGENGTGNRGKVTGRETPGEEFGTLGRGEFSARNKK